MSIRVVVEQIVKPSEYTGGKVLVAVEVDGEIVYRKVFFGQIEDREPISRGS